MGARADVLALYAFDLELRRAARVTTSPQTAEIRLAWWADAVDTMAANEAPPAHPVAQALSAAALRRRLPPQDLHRVIEARRQRLYGPPRSLVDAMSWADATHGLIASLAARILAPKADPAPAALAGRTEGLGALLAEGASVSGLREARDQALTAANQALVGWPAAGFPAAALATLARTAAPGRGASPTGRRVRLIWAVARGRI
jgi:phytoene synthase